PSLGDGSKGGDSNLGFTAGRLFLLFLGQEFLDQLALGGIFRFKQSFPVALDVFPSDKAFHWGPPTVTPSTAGRCQTKALPAVMAITKSWIPARFGKRDYVRLKQVACAVVVPDGVRLIRRGPGRFLKRDKVSRMPPTGTSRGIEVRFD